MHVLLMGLVLSVSDRGGALNELATRHAEASKPPVDSAALSTLNTSVLDLIDQGVVKQPHEFRLAAQLLTDFRFRFNITRVRHELILAGLAQDPTIAPETIAKTWDAFLISTGRKQRIGSFQFPGDKFLVEEAPKSITFVFRQPVEARAAVAKKSSNAEIAKIVADDQAVRSGDWSKFTREDIEAMAKGDEKRKARILQLLKSGKVVTLQDFANASLVLQHGSGWEDYVLAHELSICSLLLGGKKAAWLAAATYDRLLGSAGYPQRFGTQYSSDGSGPLLFDPVDPRGINDAMRAAMNCPTLQEAMNRKFD